MSPSQYQAVGRNAHEPPGQRALVSTAWLGERLGSPGLRVVDASYHLPAARRDARSEFEAKHIPGAVYFDIDAVSDTRSPLPHMLPDEATMSRLAGELGLDSDAAVVVYDVHGVWSAPRVWWMLRAFGHLRVSVLDGGLPKWESEGRPVESGVTHPGPGSFHARLDRTLVRGIESMLANLQSSTEQVVDARSAGRFAGRDAEPRAGLRRGHIPGSLNLSFSELIDAEKGTVLESRELARRFQKVGVELERPTVVSCGSGITACVLALALYLIGQPQVAVYDGSWAEWGGRDDTPVET